MSKLMPLFNQYPYICLIIGVFYFLLNRRNLIQVLISFEISLLALLLLFSGFTATTETVEGISVSCFITVVAAAETAMGLVIIVVFNKICNTIASNALTKLRN